MGDHLLNFWIWLQNAAQQAAIAEAPAVMTASGHKINRATRKVEYDHHGDNGVKQLRSNLAEIGEAGITAPGAAEALELGYNAVRHPKQTYKTVKHTVSYLRKNLRSRKPAYKITEENAASITPEQWTAMQDAAIAKGDMAEVQRLRDLHFKVSAPNSVTHEVFHHGNKEPMDWYTFDPERIGTTDEGYSGAGYYFAPTRPASQYAKERLPHTLGPHGEQNAGLSGGRYHRYVYLNGETKYKPLRDHDWTTHTDLPFVDNRPIEVVVGDNRQMKLADAVTYDNSGVRIPLGKRDNFNINDIRYGLLPFGMGFGVYNKQ